MKHIEKIKEILESELDDYSGYFNYEIEFDPDRGSEVNEIYEVIVVGGGIKKTITLCATDEKVEVEIGEDSWYQIEHFDWTIKYFWMAILSWT